MSQSVATPAASRYGPTAARAGSGPSPRLQRLVDRAASFDLFAAPDPTAGVVAPGVPGAGGGAVGFRGGARLHRFQIRLRRPSPADGVRASNVVGEEVGRLELRWLVIPDDFVARPDREPPATPLDPGRSQRIVLQECTVSFGDGDGGFRSFGTGRTLPTAPGGRPRLGVAAVGNVTEGLGRLRGFLGNFTLCGELSRERGFEGHVMVRIVDPDGVLCTGEAPPPPGAGIAGSPDVTYLTWVAQKGEGETQENRFSLTPTGEVRGLNIPVELKEVRVGFALGGPGGLRATGMVTGPVVGREIGFGREVRPRTPDSGTPLIPFQFEGVSEYLFYDPDGRTVGSLTANFLEGRSFQMRLQDAPDEPALRFGYYGPIVGAKGCFEGAEGMIYGAAGSVFSPPPAEHVITNLYVARLYDPDGRFRAAADGGGS